MKVQGVEQNYKNPTFKAKAKLVTPLEERFECDAVQGLAINITTKLRKRSDIHFSDDFREVTFNFAEATRIELQKVFAKLRLPEKIKVSFED